MHKIDRYRGGSKVHLDDLAQVQDDRNGLAVRIVRAAGGGHLAQALAQLVHGGEKQGPVRDDEIIVDVVDLKTLL